MIAIQSSCTTAARQSLRHTLSRFADSRQIVTNRDKQWLRINRLNRMPAIFIVFQVDPHDALFAVLHHFEAIDIAVSLEDVGETNAHVGRRHVNFFVLRKTRVSDTREEFANSINLCSRSVRAFLA